MPILIHCLSVNSWKQDETFILSVLDGIKKDGESVVVCAPRICCCVSSKKTQQHPDLVVAERPKIFTQQHSIPAATHHSHYMLARLARTVLFVRKGGGEGLTKAVEFYHSALGLQVIRVTEDWAELQPPPTTSLGIMNDGWTLSLQAVTTEPQVSTGYSPLLQFEITDMAMTITKCIQMGAHLDGPIQYPAHGKVAALRTPDGHMIGLYEPET